MSCLNRNRRSDCLKAHPWPLAPVCREISGTEIWTSSVFTATLVPSSIHAQIGSSSCRSLRWGKWRIGNRFTLPVCCCLLSFIRAQATWTQSHTDCVHYEICGTAAVFLPYLGHVTSLPSQVCLLTVLQLAGDRKGNNRVSLHCIKNSLTLLTSKRVHRFHLNELSVVNSLFFVHAYSKPRIKCSLCIWSESETNPGPWCSGAAGHIAHEACSFNAVVIVSCSHQRPWKIFFNVIGSRQWCVNRSHSSRI